MEQTIDKSQYSLTKIISIYLLAALPMALLGWIINPLLTPYIKLSDSISFGVARIIVMTIGLIWVFVLAMIILYKEQGKISKQILKERIWLQMPIDPKTNEKNAKLFIWLIPFFIALLLLVGITTPISQFFIDYFHVDQKYLPESLLAPDKAPLFKGAYWFLLLMIILTVFNTFLGEELLFRGILLPKMEGKFGKYDWVANGFLFGLYHLYQPWGIIGTIIQTTICFSYPARKYKSIWFSIILHSMQSVLVIIIVFFLII